MTAECSEGAVARGLDHDTGGPAIRDQRPRLGQRDVDEVDARVEALDDQRAAVRADRHGHEHGRLGHGDDGGSRRP